MVSHKQLVHMSNGNPVFKFSAALPKHKFPYCTVLTNTSSASAGRAVNAVIL